MIACISAISSFAFATAGAIRPARNVSTASGVPAILSCRIICAGFSYPRSFAFSIRRAIIFMMRSLVSFAFPLFPREAYALNIFSRRARSSVEAIAPPYSEIAMPNSAANALFSARSLFPNVLEREESSLLISRIRACEASSRAIPLLTKPS